MSMTIAKRVLPHCQSDRPLFVWLIRAALACFGLILAANAGAEENASEPQLFNVGCPLPPHAIMLRPLERAFQDALALTNAKVRFVPFPEPRALDMLYRGELDGVCGISQYAQKNLKIDKGILLKTPIAILRMIAVYDPQSIQLDKQLLFTDPRYKIGYAESGTARMFLKEKQYLYGRSISNLPQTRAVLESQRINVLIGLDVMLFNLAFQKDFGHFRYEILDTQKAYPVIHSRHREIEADLNKKLKDLVQQRRGPISLPNLDSWMAP